MKKYILWVAALCAALWSYAEVPQLINYQGRLLDGTNLVNGNVGLSLRLYNASAGGSPQYEDSNSVTVADGLYSTLLGDNTVSGSFAGALTNAQVWVEVAVNGTILSPRERVVSVAYALVAGGVPFGGVTSSMLASGAVQSVHLADGTIANADIAVNAVTGSRIADGSIFAPDLNAASFSNTFWKVDGNAGTAAGTHFLGTSDNQPLDVKANGQRVLRLSPGVSSPRIAGGHADNAVSGDGSVIAGGGQADMPNRIDVNHAFIGSGRGNVIEGTGYDSVIGGGRSNYVGYYACVIAGGRDNRIIGLSHDAAVLGGRMNFVDGEANNASIGGGLMNLIGYSSGAAAIAGGTQNAIGWYAPRAAIGGGWSNTVSSFSLAATICGGDFNTISSNAPHTVIGGGYGHRVGTDSPASTIGGGLNNGIGNNAEYAVVAGGLENHVGANARRAVIGGGAGNLIDANADFTMIAGGWSNAVGINADGSVVAGGFENRVGLGAYHAVIGGGMNNDVGADGAYAVIAGGRENDVGANATNAFAAGRQAKANHRGSFVWADDTEADFASSNVNQFCVRAGGGMRLETGWNSPGIMLDAADRAMITRGFDQFTSGVHTGAGRWGLFMEPNALTLGMPAVGGKVIQMAKYNTDSTRTALMTLDQDGNMTIAGTYSPPSDRNLKTDFAEVNRDDVLEKVAALPIQTWRYRHEGDGPRHIGPVAQDFHAAFAVGADDKHIATVDADGVALAAIQGLYRMVQEQQARIEALEDQLKKQRKGDRL